jgi:hypothetical protein
MRPLLLVAASAAVLAHANVALAAPVPIKVMVVGLFHMSNPGHDLHNTKAADVLDPKQQLQIKAVTAALNRFHPTKVAVEWDASTVAERYPKYLAGTLDPSRNEVVQLGFRLAKMAGNKPVYGIDADADMPYEAMINYGKSHGQSAVWDGINARVARSVDYEQKLLDRRGIAPMLRYLNSAARLKLDNSWYRDTLRIGGGSDQPAVDLLKAWYGRNLHICANLVQVAKPGDRIVVFYGAGHAFLLRQCVAESTGFELTDPNHYFPK